MWARVGADSVRVSKLGSLKKFLPFFVSKRKIKECVCVFVSVRGYVSVRVFVWELVFSWRFFGGRQLTSESGIVSRGPSSSSSRVQLFFRKKKKITFLMCTRQTLSFFCTEWEKTFLTEIELKWWQWRRNCQVVIGRRYCKSFCNSKLKKFCF
jgi:hypothetical protein